MNDTDCLSILHYLLCLQYAVTQITPNLDLWFLCIQHFADMTNMIFGFYKVYDSIPQLSIDHCFLTGSGGITNPNVLILGDNAYFPST